jgi:hypothetical protein
VWAQVLQDAERASFSRLSASLPAEGLPHAMICYRSGFTSGD